MSVFRLFSTRYFGICRFWLAVMRCWAHPNVPLNRPLLLPNFNLVELAVFGTLFPRIYGRQFSTFHPSLGWEFEKMMSHLSKRVFSVVSSYISCMGWVGEWDQIWTDSGSQRRLYKLTSNLRALYATPGCFLGWITAVGNPFAVKCL